MAQTVTVGCKLPNGLILEMGEKRVTLNGANSSSIVGGHGLTEGVDKEFFDAWMAKNKHLHFVKEGHLFAHEKEVNTKAQAKERAKEKTGLEQLNPDEKPAGLSEVE
jgi:hypothetical protein